MLVHDPYEDQLLQLIRDFSPTVDYEGYGIAEFSEPVGSVEGPTKAHFDEFGEYKVQMTVAKFTTKGVDKTLDPHLLEPKDYHEAFESPKQDIKFDLYRHLLDYINGIPNNRCKSLTIYTSQGKLLARNIGKSYGMNNGEESIVIEFTPLTLDFESNLTTSSCFFVFPLLNFIPEFEPFFETKGIDFSSNYRLASIAAVPNYRALCEDLLACKSPKAITAFIVGGTGGEQIDNQNWARFKNLLPLLSLATGSKVSAPWLAILDKDRAVIRRLHINLAASRYGQGMAAFQSESSQGGIGQFLTQAQLSPEFGQLYLRAAIDQIVRGGYLNFEGNDEDKMSHLFRGLEALCKGQLSGRVSYGERVLKLLEKFKLQDAQVIDKYINDTNFVLANKYAQDRNEKKTWEIVLSAYRNIVMHNAWFDWQANKPDANELWALIHHTRDLALRLILKSLNYDGEYMPSIWHKYGSSGPLDWVNDSSTTPLDLGYVYELDQINT